MQASPGVKLELSGEELNQLQSREVIYHLPFCILYRIFLLLCTSCKISKLWNFEFVAGPPAALWQMLRDIFGQSEPYSHIVHPLHQGSNRQSILQAHSIVLIKVDAYVFFHLPGQFLNEDSLSKVKQSVGSESIQSLFHQQKEAKIFHHCYIFSSR